MAIRQVTKNLAGKEDITRDIGSEVQVRANKEYEITKLNATHLEGAIIVDTIKDLLALDISKLEANPKVYVLGYHEVNDGGGGLFVYDEAEPKSNHNGGTIIDSTKGFPTDWNDSSQLASWFTGDGTGNGGWKRVYDSAVNVKWFGAKGDGVTDDTKAIQTSLFFVSKINTYEDFNEVNEVYNKPYVYSVKLIIPSGIYPISDTIFLDNSIFIEGDSPLNTKIILHPSFSSTRTRTLYLPEGKLSVSFMIDSRSEVASEWS